MIARPQVFDVSLGAERQSYRVRVAPVSFLGEPMQSCWSRSACSRSSARSTGCSCCCSTADRRHC